MIAKGLLVAAVLALALARPAAADEDFQPRSEIEKWWRGVVEKRKALLRANRRKIRDARGKYEAARKRVRDQARAKECRRDKACRERHVKWAKEARAWWTKLRAYAREGGEAPGWDPPAVPEPGSSGGDDRKEGGGSKEEASE